MALRPDGPVVVGVDGSENSAEALRWGAEYALWSASPVTVVMTWQFPTMYGAAPVATDIDFQADAEKMAEKMIAEARKSFPDVEFTSRVVAGPAAQVLVQESEQARLLVVGSRGHGAFVGMLIGSVSTHCVQHAHCPVVVVR